MDETTPAGWRIRQATLDDVADTARLRMAMLEEIENEHPHTQPLLVDLPAAMEINVRWAREHLGRDLSQWHAVSEADGCAIGSAGIIWFQHAPSRRNPAGLEAYILNVYVEPEWRRLGIARRLMETVVAAAEERGALRVWLRASDQGRPLYESMGFGPRNYLELGSRA